MPTPSAEIIQVLDTFAPAFTKPTFRHALILLYGTLLAVGARTVTAALRAPLASPTTLTSPPTIGYSTAPAGRLCSSVASYWGCSLGAWCPPMLR